MIRLELQPSSAPKEIAERSATTAGKKIPSPVQSKRTRAMRLRLRGTSRIAARAPKSPKGTFTKKMRRQPPAARSSPPMVGPKPSPRAWAAPWRPMARPSDRAGTTSTMMARLFACNIAAPIACSARKPHSAAEVRGQAAEHGGKGEDQEAVDVEELAAPHVGEAPDGDHGGHQDQQVGQPDPRDRPHRDAEGALQGGEGDRDDGRIELAHECADAHRRHGEPVGIAGARVWPRAAAARRAAGPTSRSTAAARPRSPRPASSPTSVTTPACRPR